MCLINKQTDALIIIDVQNDFCEGGSLAVPNANEIFGRVNALAEAFDKVIITQDYHPQDQISFASNHEGGEPFSTIDTAYGKQVLWPDHCVMGTTGVGFHPEIFASVSKAIAIIRKGYNKDVDSYSAFFENDHKTATGLAGMLKELGVKRIFLCGLALDYCVRYTAVDGHGEGFEVVVVTDATRSISPATEDDARQEFIHLGIHEVMTAQVQK